MTFNKETRDEEMNNEIREDYIREQANEVNEGSFETWCDDNEDSLTNEFLNQNEKEFNNFCKEMWNEEND